MNMLGNSSVSLSFKLNINDKVENHIKKRLKYLLS